MKLKDLIEIDLPDSFEFNLKEEETTETKLDSLKDQIEIEYDESLYQNLQAELAKGNEEFVTNWFIEHGYEKDFKKPTNEALVRQEIKKQIKRNHPRGE